MQLFQKLQDLAPDLQVLLHLYQVFIGTGLNGGEKMRKRQVLIDKRSIAKDVVVVTNYWYKENPHATPDTLCLSVFRRSVFLEVSLDSFVESKNVGEPGVRFKPFDEFAGWAQTLVVPGRAASAKLIKFLTADEFATVPGRYVIELFAYEGETLRPSNTINVSFTASPHDIEKLRATKPDMEGSGSKSQLRLPLEANAAITKSV